MAKGTSANLLPPGVEQKGSQLVRVVERTAADGSVYKKERPVALTFIEAQEKRWDYYHPELGWILEGYKLAQDRPVESIMADGSIGGARPDPSEDD